MDYFKSNSVPRTDYSGYKFGKLTVVSFYGHAKQNNKDSVWNCICDCGNTKVTRIRTLKSGNTKTCGLCPKPVGNKHLEWKGCGELSRS